MHPLQEFLESCHIETRSYSGRGMYGTQCLAVSVNNLGSFVADMVAAARLYWPSYTLEMDQTIGALRTMQTDQLGMGIIVYFPNVPYTAV